VVYIFFTQTGLYEEKTKQETLFRAHTMSLLQIHSFFYYYFSLNFFSLPFSLPSLVRKKKKSSIWEIPFLDFVAG